MASDSAVCLEGAERVSPPMQASPVASGSVARVLRAHGFDTTFRWPRKLFSWWGRVNLKEVVDLRLYRSCKAWCDRDGRGWEEKCAYAGCSGCAPCSVVSCTKDSGTGQCREPRMNRRPHLSACGGRPGRSSSRSLRTGWRASGAPCTECVHETRYLNCGPNQAPHQAHRKSIDAFRTAPGASVRGRCTLQSGSVRDLDAPSVSGFVAAALARECKYAYLWWPTGDV